ncbi:MAG: mycofactocin-coupled SDR family oxidoreductase [Actinomycetota bacterium]|jgi:SDR family mycofactocin-dependent oxidoreductase|nr:mycofactocin-coupled SDR family oxidoreductase [Actinomycetota bacterium]
MGAVEGKVAFVTGAARGQGRSHAVRLAAEGADVIAVDLCAPVASAAAPAATLDDLDETVRLVEAAGGRIVARVADVRDHEAMTAAVAEGAEAFGTVDIVVANAGISTVDGLFTCTPEVWRETIDVNLTGVFNTLVAGVGPMVAAGAGGSVVLVSSIMGLRAAGGIPAYTAAKHGVVGLMRSAAHDLAPHRIRVNSVHPGNVRTPMIDNPGMHALFRPDLAAPTLDDMAAGLATINLLPEPWVEPEDVTEAVLWLASDAARFVTGVTLPVDLGATVK